MTDLLGGRIDVASLVLGTAAGQNVRVIGIFAETRHPAFADVPTVKEQGYDVSPIELRRTAGAGRHAGAGVAKLSKPATARRRTKPTRRSPSAPRSRRTITTTPKGFRARLDRDTAAKARVLARIKAKPQ